LRIRSPFLRCGSQFSVWSVVSLSALLVIGAPAVAAAKWTRIRTEHFVFVGDASEGEIRRVAQKLDQFREVLRRVLPGNGTRSPVPTIVIVFRNNAAFEPYKPHFQGHSIKVSGYFQPGEDANYMAVNAEDTDDAFNVIFHEYTHFVVSNSAGIVPVWVNEGLAEVYATFQERNGGKSAMLGMANLEHVGLLRASVLMPLRDLMAVDHNSPVYNEGNRRNVFYAESWAVMHYLMFGNTTRAQQLRGFLASLSRGVVSEQASRDAFGTDLAALEHELDGYIHKYQFPAIRVEFPDKVTGAASERGLPIADAEASAYLGDLLARIGRVDDARAHFRKLMESDPRSARATYGLGVLEVRSKHLDRALPLLERAAALDGGEPAYLSAFGAALMDKWDEDRNSPSAADTLLRARTVLSRSTELAPPAVPTLVALARAEMAESSNLPHAAALLEQVVGMAPARESYRLLLAYCLLEQDEFEKATMHLGPLAAQGRRADVRDTARRMLGILAARKNLPHDARAAGPALDQPVIPDEPVAREGPVEPPRESAPQGVFIPSLRTLVAGESRVFGLFSAVECGRDAITLTISVDSRTFHFSASKFDDVEFISYRPEPPGTVKCGSIQPPVRVLATYILHDGQTTTGLDGRLVAIELLPDGYTPK
jgi:tetratricopeptide repeat protein/uncharacterized protein DUF1570